MTTPAPGQYYVVMRDRRGMKRGEIVVVREANAGSLIEIDSETCRDAIPASRLLNKQLFVQVNPFEFPVGDQYLAKTASPDDKWNVGDVLHIVQNSGPNLRGGIILVVAQRDPSYRFPILGLKLRNPNNFDHLGMPARVRVRVKQWKVDPRQFDEISFDQF